MKKLITSITLFLMFCALPFIGLILTKIGYPEFKTNIDFAWGIAASVIVGLVVSVVNYVDPPKP